MGWKRKRNHHLTVSCSIDDGAVRLWKNYDGSEQEEAQLVSAWRALKDMEKSSMQQSGLVCDWHQERGTLFTGGDARLIKVWDVHQEMPIMVSLSFSFLDPSLY